MLTDKQFQIQRTTLALDVVDGGRRAVSIPSPSPNACEDCFTLAQIAIFASNAYHVLVADLEAAHIRKDADAPMLIEVHMIEALGERDDALADLTSHRITHSKLSVKKHA